LGRKPNGKWIIMKTPHMVVGATLVGLLAGLLSGCAHSRAGGEMEFGLGPMVSSDGVTNYPAKPGATYTNAPVDYTTNPPPAGVAAGVTVISTNGVIRIHSIDPVAVPK
jgi:hypothetical protein